MSKLVLTLNGPHTKQNVRDALSNAKKARIQDFAYDAAASMGEFNSTCSARLFNGDDAAATATVTTHHSNQTDGDVIQIGTMVLTAKSPGSTNPLAPNLMTAASFAVLANSTITNTGGTVITGNLGLSPGSSVTGFPPGSVIGTQHITDAAAAQAQVDLTSAYNDLVSRTFTTDESGVNLGTLTLAPGVYKYSSSAQLTGTLTLDAGGNPNAVWIFQIGSTLTTASSSVVSIINGGSAGNVYWQVGSSATLGTSTNFAGSILAQASITFNTSATMNGRALARTGAVTLDTNTITKINGTLGGGVIVLSPNQFLIGASDAASAANLAAAINADSNGLLTARSSGAIVTVFAAYTGFMGNAVPIIISEVDAFGMVASGTGLIGGQEDTSVAKNYNNFY